MRQHRAVIWGILALAVAATLLAVALAGRGGSDVAAASVTVHDHGTATAVEPGTPQYREMRALAGRLVGEARTEVAALAQPWEAAERCKQEGVALEVVFAAPGVAAGVHGTYAMALIPLDQTHEPGRVLVYLGVERYTLLVPADADEELARLCELAKVAVPSERWWPEVPTVAPAPEGGLAMVGMGGMLGQPNDISLYSFPEGELLGRWDTGEYQAYDGRWSADGKRLAVVGNISATGEYGLFVIEP